VTSISYLPIVTPIGFPSIGVHSVFEVPSSPVIPRKATNPANAILNYLYSILEAEARMLL
jgi:hypothetical protein